jgi:hypothetical protein
MALKSCKWQDTPVGQTLLESVGLDGTATKEELEKILETRAANFTLPQYAMTTIAAPWSYDFRFLIPAGDKETTRQKIQFEEPVIVIGFGFEVTTDTYGRPGPEPKELDVRLDARMEREFWTARNDSKASKGPNGYVPLSLVDFRAPRFFFRILHTADAEIGVQLRTRYATGFSDDVLVDCCVIALPLDWR